MQSECARVWVLINGLNKEKTMRHKLDQEIQKMINQAREEMMDYYIRPMQRSMQRLESLLNCSKGKHSYPTLHTDKTVCSICGETLGKIVPPNAECKVPGKAK